MSEKIEAWAVTYEYYYGSTRDTYDWHPRVETFELLERAQEAIAHMQNDVDIYRNISAPIPLVERRLLEEAIGFIVALKTYRDDDGEIAREADEFLARTKEPEAR